MTEITRRIVKAVAYMEKHLDDDFRLTHVSDAACYSHYHFLRLFHALSGLTVGTYLRRRRLTKAGEALMHSETRILEIAQAAGFDSQAAFTRAFKEMFNVSPAQFRGKKNAPAFRGQPIITETYLQHLQTEGITMKPRFARKEAFTAIGLGKDFDLAAPHSIGLLWDAFLCRKESLPSADGRAYGICYAPKEEEAFSDKFHYTAAVRVPLDAIPPKGMEKLTVAAQEYAIFTHKGLVETLTETNNYIWKTWLPQSGLALADAPDIEVYGDKWRDGDPASEIEIWVPIQR